MLKKILLNITILYLLFTLTSCVKGDIHNPGLTDNEEEGLKVVATLFPQYDFAREIAGDKAEITLLLPPGAEAHSFEPTPADIIKINKADLFIYTGPDMENWAQRIIDGLDNPDIIILNASQGINLASGEPCPDSNCQQQNGDESTGHSHEPDISLGEDHPLNDPHIWTSPLIAGEIVENIAEALCVADPQNREYFQENKRAYQRKLNDLDQSFKAVIKAGKRNKMVFGSSFAFYYFTSHYGLDVLAAYDSCSSHTEPSVKRIAEIIDTVKKEGIPVIYYDGLTEPKIAAAISEATGAKMLLFHSCHNLSKEEKENGASYLSLMEQNLENLKQGLE